MDRTLVGPPAATVYNPTVYLFFGVIAGIGLSLVAYSVGIVPLGVSTLIHLICLYVLYTVNHEAAHGLAHKNATVNHWLGRVSAALEGITFPIYRVLHLKHHTRTNHPQQDPDFVLGRKPRWLLPVWLFVRLTHDNFFMMRHGLWKGRTTLLTEHLVTIALQAMVIIGASVLGYGWEVLLLWVVPMIIAAATIEMTVAWLVHYPHESQHRLENTRLIKGRLWQGLMLNQNYHLVHHLWPSIPWYRYGKAVDVAEDAVVRHGQDRSSRSSTGK